MSKKVINLRCNTETLTGKFLVESAAENNYSPNTNVLNEAIQSNESWYQVAKELTNKYIFNIDGLAAKGNRIVSDIVDRPSEILKDIDNGRFVDDILNDYSQLVDEFYSNEDIGSLKSVVKDHFEWDYKEKRFAPDSNFEEYNQFLDNISEQKLNYIDEWFRNLEQPAKSTGLIGEAAKLLRKNYLTNSVSSALMNSMQLTQTVIPNAKIEHFLKGVESFMKDRKNGYSELVEMGVGNKAHIEDIASKKEKFDLFMLPEKFNQGISYFTGKSEALSKGMSEAEAKEAGIKFNEKVNFISRAGNQPRAYWDGSTKDSLALMSYTMQFNKMYFDNVKKAFKGNKDAIGMLAKYTAMTTVLFGAEAAIPVPMWALLDDDTKKELSQTPSVFKSILNLDLTDNVRPGAFKFTPVTFSTLTKLYDTTDKLVNDAVALYGEDGLDALSEPKLHKDLVKFLRAGMLFVPHTRIPLLDKTNIGTGQAGELMEMGYRIFEDNHTRQDWNTKEIYETDNTEEVLRILGVSASEKKKAYGIN